MNRPVSPVKGRPRDNELRNTGNTLPRLVGFGGKLRSGKDAAADALVSLGYRRHGFSEPIRAALLALDPYVAVEGYLSEGTDYIRLSRLDRELGWTGAKDIPEVRRLAQQYGEGGRENFGSDLIVRGNTLLLDRRLSESPVVSTGIRFPSEHDLIKERGGVTIWVERDQQAEGHIATHATERGIDSDTFDFVIVNDGSVEDLHAKVLDVLAEVAR